MTCLSKIQGAIKNERCQNKEKREVIAKNKETKINFLNLISVKFIKYTVYLCELFLKFSQCNVIKAADVFHHS